MAKVPHKNKPDETDPRILLGRSLEAVDRYNGLRSTEKRLMQALHELEAWLVERRSASTDLPHDRNEAEQRLLEGLLSEEPKIAPLTISNLLEQASQNFLKRLSADEIPFDITQTELCFLPPDHQEGPVMGSGSGSEPPRFERRFDKIVKLLKDQGIFVDGLKIYDGTLQKNQIRQQPYRLLQIPRLGVEILVCDQVGEATFVGQGLRGPEWWAVHTKSQLEQEVDVRRIVHTEGWEARLRHILRGNFEAAAAMEAQETTKPPAQPKVPKKEHDWMSGKYMAEVYVGDATKFNSLLKAYAEQQTQELINNGQSPEEVAAFVAKNLVGERTCGTKQALCASPGVLQELFDLGKLRLKSDKAPKKEPDWMSGTDMIELYVGDSPKFNLLLQDYADQKKQALIAEGQSPEEAAAFVDKSLIGVRICGTLQALCASPVVLQELSDQGKLQLKSDKAPKKEPDWISGMDMQEIYVGSSVKFTLLLQAYAQEKVQALIAEGQPPEEAKVFVAKNLVGKRSSGSHQALCASPAVIQELSDQGKLQLKSDKVPEKDPDWMSGKYMAEVYVGGAKRFTLLLQDYAQQKVQALIAEGQPLEEAEVFVAKNFVGKRSNKAGRQALCASPVVLQELSDQGKLQLKSDKAPEKEPGWMSGNDMRGVYAGSNVKFTLLLQDYAQEKIRALIAEGRSPEEATAFVDKNLVGMRSSGSEQALCASPAVIEELRSSGKIRLRESQALVKEDWRSSQALCQSCRIVVDPEQPRCPELQSVPKARALSK